VPAVAGFDCKVGDLIKCKQFPMTPLLVENIMYHGCDVVYVVRHDGFVLHASGASIRL